MRNCILTLLFLFPSIFFTSANSFADNGISRDDAVKRVKELLQKDNEQSYKYYTSKTILKDTVAYGKNLQGKGRRTDMVLHKRAKS